MFIQEIALMIENMEWERIDQLIGIFMKVNGCMEKEGKGIMRYHYGDMYNGLWKNGKQDGRGICTMKNADIYEGEWKNDLEHGRGILKAI